MGAIHFPSGTFPAAITEVVGYKSGLALSYEQILEHLENPEYVEIAMAGNDGFVRVRSEVFEGIILGLLYKLGRVSSPEPISPFISVFRKYKEDAQASEVAMQVMEMFGKFLRESVDKFRGDAKGMDPTPFLDEVLEEHGFLGAEIGIELCRLTNASVEASPWSRIRSIEWKDITELEKLFESESFSTNHGQFFDQRFIDYLHQNFGRIDEINWRQFEGLTAEFFIRMGFHVEIGPGRNDGGIDIRVWPTKEAASKPPAILIQCKRQQKKISKVVVKALYADILDENADSGLIVTSSTLSPGAARVLTARSYPIDQANRETLKEWIAAMRVPGSGVFLGQ